MVQNLLNNNNITIHNTSPSVISSNLSTDASSKTDFQKLFDKQNQTHNSDKPKTFAEDKNNVTGNKDEDDSSKKSISKDETFVGSVAYDIRQLIAFLQSAAKDGDTQAASDEVEESVGEAGAVTTVQETDEITDDVITEELDAEEIVKKLLHLEEEEDAEETKETAEENTSTPKQEDAESFQDLTINKKLDTVLDELGSQTTEAEEITLKPAKTAETEESEGKTLEEIIDEDTLKELNIESVEAETPDSGEGSDLMKNQTAEEQGIKASLQVDADFADVKGEVKPTSTVSNVKSTTNTAEANPSKILEQISKQMENLQNGSKVNIILNPESIGKVSVQLINTKEGLSAQFTVASQEARNLIMKGIDGLKDTLLSHGVNVDNVSVKLNETQDTEYSADWTEQEGSRGGNKEQGSNRGQQGKENFEQMMSFIQDEEN